MKFLLILLLVASSHIMAAPSLEDYGKLPAYSLIRLSPDGNRIVMRSRDENHDVIKIFSLAEKKTISTIDISAVKAQDVYFLNTNQLVLNVSEEKFLREYKEKFLQISSAILYDIPSKKFTQLLTPGDVIYTGQLGLGDISAIAADNKHVFMPAYVDKEKYRAAQPLYSLLKVNLAKPKRPKILTKGTNHTINFFAHPNGTVLAREDFNNRQDLHTILSFSNNDWNTIYENKTAIPEFGISGLTADYKSLIIVDESDETNHDAYYTMSLKNGDIKEIPLGRTDADIEHAYTDLNQVIFGVGYSGLKPSYKFFDSQLNKRLKSLVEKNSSVSVHLISWSANWDKIIVLLSGTGTPNDYYVIDQSGTATYLTSGYPKIKPDEVHLVTSHAFKARDGLEIPTILTIPNSQVANLKNLPAILLPHGGPRAHDEIGFYWKAQALANAGYLVIQPQFRGSDGFGTQHILAGEGEWGKKMQDDLTDSIAYFTKKGTIDPKRICIVGSSYGGYAALAAAAFTPDLFQCAVAINGVSDLHQMLKEEKSEHDRDHWVVAYWEKQFAKDKIAETDLKAISPYYFAEKFNTPTLLIYSDKDKTVSAKHSKRMAKALKKFGKEVTLIGLKGETHYMENSETRLQSLQATVDFVNKYIGNKPAAK